MPVSVTPCASSVYDNTDSVWPFRPRSVRLPSLSTCTRLKRSSITQEPPCPAMYTAALMLASM